MTKTLLTLQTATINGTLCFAARAPFRPWVPMSYVSQLEYVCAMRIEHGTKATKQIRQALGRLMQYRQDFVMSRATA